ncbi:MAG: TraR/DksA C4-type zinc finger protein [Nitrospirota bacterium]|nr:MAG: TraR/DksA C4-type zinc finger protein [Nitrospirota bacterium]
MKEHRPYEQVVEFHGHSCPGLALGYRVSLVALKEFEGRASDEELVAVVENDSCAVDAVQVMTGCTFGKGNLIFKDHGKQTYTFFERPYPEALRINVKWKHPEESEEESEMWRRYKDGDRSEEVTKAVHNIKGRKLRSILEADDRELFNIQKINVELPPTAKILPSIKCTSCGEMVMETRARVKDGNIVCIPCMEKKK